MNYVYSLLHLYMHGKKSLFNYIHGQNSLKVYSKAAKFFAVGLSGLLVNYALSINLANGSLAKLWYIESTLIGIMVSFTTNFILNKIWTFADRDFSIAHFIEQYLIFIAISGFGTSIRLGLVYTLTETSLPYETSLLIAVLIASFSNYIFNKKFTFREKIWG